MSLNYYWESFIRKLKGKPGSRDYFENLMLELLKVENPDKEVHRIAASPGDGGIDILVQQDNGIDIYQCKFFTDELGESQRNQIRKSFNKAMEDKGVTVLRWFLCMPREQELEEISWVHNFIKKRSDVYGVEMHFIYGTEITNRMEAVAPELIDKYFPITAPKHFTNKSLIVPFTKEDSNSAQGGTYIPRDDLLSKIADSFQSQSGNKRMVFLSGMGGCGKSELARAYAERHSSAYEEIFWLTCTDGIRPDLMTLMSNADTLCDVKKEDVVAFSNTVLIIVDNCNNNDSKFLRELEHSTGLADILVSTRLRYIGSYKNIISIESDEPEKFTFEVFERNYCKVQPWGEPKEIKEDEICPVHDICRAVQYNTMIVSLIGLRLCEYDNLSIADCAKKIRTGVGSIKGTFDYSKDLDPRSEEMKDVLHFLFQDILYPTVPVTREQKEVLSVLSLTPATWYEGNYIYSLTGGGTENTNHEYAAKKLLSFGWLQGSSDKMAIHPLIAEAISGEPISISDPKFYYKLLNNYLGLQEKYLAKNHFLINEIIKRSGDALPEAKIAAMLLINNGGYKKIFAKKFPNVSTAYFVYEAHDWSRFYYYQDIEKQSTCLLLNIPCQTKEDDSVKLLKIYSTGVPYVLDLSTTISNKEIAKIPAGLCYEDPNICNCIFSQHLTVIENHAFAGCSNLSGELRLPDSLTRIGEQAFFGCSGLSCELRLPDSLKSIENRAFAGCSNLSGELRLPNTLNNIGEGAFFKCSGLLGELRLPDSLNCIAGDVFSGCSGLSGELRLPDKLISIGDWTFSGCSGFTGELHLPNTLKSIGIRAFAGCSGFSNELHLPETLTSIGSGAFDGCTGFSGELRLPDSLTSIGEQTFANCTGLSGVLRLPDGLTSLEDKAFSGCCHLSGELRLPEKLADIGDGTFYGCSSLSGELRLPEKLISIGDWAFANCSGLSGELRLPDSLTSIGYRAFFGCSGLSGDLHLPDRLISIGRGAFDGCSGLLGEQHSPDKLTNIAYRTPIEFTNLSSEINLPDSLTSIVEEAFSGRSDLSGELHLPDSITTIGDWAFYECSGLSGELRLPDNLTNIGEGAFYGCSGFSGKLCLPDSLISIGEGAFFGCSGFSGELRLPDNLTSIGEGVFYNCTGLSGELHLPDNLQVIRDETFVGCSGLSGELHLPDSLTSIGKVAFAGCSSLSGELRLPNSLCSIGERAFYGCSNLSGELFLPDSLISIGEGAFDRCSGLSGELRLPYNLTSIGSMSFNRCNAIEKIVFNNPNTIIEGRINPFSSTIICGYKNSTAEEYALKNGLVFEELKPDEQ